MYLKKLSIQGFKSFANRTTFEFSTGITAIVGPNGSGKSNVADGIRWVLGEQSIRLLRARRTEDVIFSGTRDRAAVGMAEVLLTLDNSERWLPVEFGEVEIGRRVFRNGDSEYLVNGQKVRLRDVADLLMKGDVGQNSYAIMGQGLVDEVLSMNADERRIFLDEAADVRRFRVKIKEAQDRLAATRENIGRVQLIVDELEPRLAQLSRQAERAGLHAKFSSELAQLLRLYFTHRWNDAQNSLVRGRAALDQASAEAIEAADRVGALREELRGVSDEIRKRREAVAASEADRAAQAAKLADLAQAIALDTERLAMVERRVAELTAEMEVLEAERPALAGGESDEVDSEQTIRAQMDAARAAVVAQRKALDVAESEYAAARAAVRELLDGAETEDRHATEATREAARIAERLTALGRDRDQQAPRRRELISELREYGARFAELIARVTAAEADLESSREGARIARERLARVQDEVRTFEAAANQELRELDQLEGRLAALVRVQAEHDGVAAGTRAALQMGNRLPGGDGGRADVPGVLGLVSQQLRVPAGMESAINAALEARLHAVIVQSEEAALLAVENLRQSRRGRAQFLALDAFRHVYPLNLQKEKGVVGVASRLVRCEKPMQPLIDTLLGRVIVCEDPETAVRMLRRGLGTCVTVDGTYFEGNGLVSGGSSGADEGPFARQREIEELPEAITAMRTRAERAAHQLEEARSSVTRLSQAARDAEGLDQTVRRNLDAARGELERERGRLHRLRREMAGFRSRQGDLIRERERLEAQAATQKTRAAEHARLRDERRGGLAAAEERLTLATAARDAALREVSDAGVVLATLDGELKARAAVREQRGRSLLRLDHQVQSRQDARVALDTEREAIVARIAHQQSAHAEALAALDAPGVASPDREALTQLEVRERALQATFSEAQATLLAADRRRLDIESDVNRAQNLIESLRNEMDRDGFVADRAGNVVGAEEQFPQPAVAGAAEVDITQTRHRIEELRREIRKLGAVNMDAPEDYRESKERHEFLTSQLADLGEAETQLREAITHLGGEIRTRFGEAFERVNKAFGEYFTSFFGGGAARLILVDPEDLAESGIDIEATPPGKRIKSLMLLSGGERSLTAVALLFALLTVNPAPFCVLDEVDAALDEANVGRFTTALRKLSENTQFVIITHNRKTVEVADAIHGISMGRDGVSRTLSMMLADLPAN
jgi:chromosome segregation protein